MKRTLVVILLASGLFGCGQGRLSDGPSPDFSVENINGGKLEKSALHGHPVVIDFWETWCQPCRMQMPEVQKLYKDYAPKGVQVLGISDESKKVVSPFVRDRSLSYEFGLDSVHAMKKAFGVDGYPTMILLDRDGNIVYSESPPDIDKVREILDRMTKS